MLKIKENINFVRDEINQNSHKTEKAIRLVAVSKGQSYIAIKSAYDAGQKIFGENRVQEALQRWEKKFEIYKDIELRLIGPLQTNKVKLLLNLF